MNVNSYAAGASLVSFAASVAIAVLSVALAHRVNYLDHLSLFNALAMAILVLGLIALIAALGGAWSRRDTSRWGLVAVIMAWNAFLFLNP